MALPNNRKAVLEILDVLEPKLLGNMIGNYVAVEIVPGGDDSPGAEMYWNTWHILVRMGEPGHEEYDLKGLASFPAIVSTKDLDSLFGSKFRSAKVISAEAAQYDPTDEMIRIMLGDPAAVAIADNSRRISFRFSWGREQETGEAIDTISRRYSRIHSSLDTVFAEVLALLKQISPVTYKGGPEPEYSFESHWLMDYELALKIAVAAKSMTVTGVVTSVRGSGDYKVSAVITFFK